MNVLKLECYSTSTIYQSYWSVLKVKSCILNILETSLAKALGRGVEVVSSMRGLQGHKRSQNGNQISHFSFSTFPMF